MLGWKPSTMTRPKKTAIIRSTADLARQLGLSRWTVSRALNGHNGVGAETAKAVREAMQASGFSPSSLAQGLRRGSTHHIGVCLPDLENFYLGPKLESFRRELGANGFRLMIGMSNNDADEEARVLHDFRALRVAGIATFASRLSEVDWACLTQDGLPSLRIDPLVGAEARSLGVDRAYGMWESTRHLLQLGHQRIALLGIGESGRYSRARLRGVKKAVAEAKLEFDRTIVSFPVDGALVSDLERGRAAAENIVSQVPQVTAVMALNDRMATGLISGLRALRCVVPDDMSVIGYDNMPLLDYVAPSLTSVDPQVDELMARATQALILSIRGENSESGTPKRVRARLVVKGSTGPVRSHVGAERRILGHDGPDR